MCERSGKETFNELHGTALLKRGYGLGMGGGRQMNYGKGEAQKWVTVFIAATTPLATTTTTGHRLDFVMLLKGGLGQHEVLLLGGYFGFSYSL